MTDHKVLESIKEGKAVYQTKQESVARTADKMIKNGDFRSCEGLRMPAP